MDDISLDLSVGCPSLDSDPLCNETTSDECLLLHSVSSKVFAEQLTCKDAVSGLAFLSALFGIGS